MLAGRSMLEWSVQTFLIDAACRGLVVALAPDDEHWSQVRSRLQRVPIEAVGGAERADSVRSALQRLQASGVGASASKRRASSPRSASFSGARQAACT